ncbi:canalicular multispecific organic anion transporter 2 [Diaporthe helianthi]|uniref:Canalicular multispecific organic anion transporter 2 n=1 Tax=Diaporthe helianthi TaxID=158607 RepID=A0A2P5I1H3_DIAHE|nr:canalicular multispecific organic anion transporter 2 [Diaporthe helianthi]
MGVNSRQLGCANIDSSFGPAVPVACRGGFDFTILFEQVFFVIIPAAALTVAASLRVWQLCRSQTVTPWTALQYSKQYVFVFGLENGFVDSIDNRNFPFVLAVQVRTLWLAETHDDSLQRIAILASVGLSLKVLLLLLEAVPKRSFIIDVALSREQTAGVYSLRTFWWLNGIFWLGSRKRLQHNDLYSIDQGLKTARFSSQLAAAWNRVDQNKKYALLLAVFSTLKWPLLLPALPRLILIGFNYAQPLLIRRVLEFIDDSLGQENIGYGLIGATIVIYTGLAIFNGYYGHLLSRSITLVRGSLVDIIYSKSLCVELSVAQEAAPAGLVTADVERIDFTVEKLHSLWASVIELALGTYLLKREVGWACIAPVIVALLCTFSTTYISKLISSRQKKWNQAVQQRVALTSSMLSNLKSVKMMGFSSYIANTLQEARMKELAASSGFRKFMAVINTIVLIPRQLSAPFTLTLYVLAVRNGPSAARLSAARAFTTLSLIEMITTPLGLLLQTLPSITSSLACLDRIQAYLKSPERTDQRAEDIDLDCELAEKDFIESSLSDLPAIYLKHASIAYTETGDCVLNSITLTVPHGSITSIVGPVGSAKSSLLKSLLGELYLQSGYLYVRPGPIAYCDQNAWIPNGSFRDCIIGPCDGEFDSAWYQEVIHACVLEEDINSFADGSDTNVGSRGITLSDGQKHRLALARAVYSRAPLLILDDMLRSLDLRTEMLISRHLSLVNQIAVLDQHGTLVQIGDFHKLNSCEGHVRDLCVQERSPQPSSPDSDSLVPGDDAQQRSGQHGHSPKPEKPLPKREETSGKGAQRIGTRSSGDYRFYFSPVGIWRTAVLLFAVICLAFATRFQRIWVEWWTEAYNQHSFYAGMYFMLALIACLSFTFFFWWMFMFVVPITAGGLHEQLVHSIFNARFDYLTTIDSGTILNRFSQDMAILNGQLAVAFFQTTSLIVMALSQIAFIAYGSKYMAASIPPTLVVLWLLSQFYLRTSRQLRILDIELKAPIYTSLIETQEGLATIRAFGWVPSYRRRCQSRIDDSKKAIYLLSMAQRWLAFVLDLIVAGLASVLVALATQLRTTTDAGALGVGLTSVIGFSTLVSQFISAYAELENSLGAVTRVKDCIENVKSEDTSTGQPPPREWPGHGAVDFCNVTATYNDIEKPALSDISFRVSPGQKVVICGRTGSGKSTLVSALLRLVDVQAGQIHVDGIDISTLSPEAVRRCMTVIPQTPFFLPGSVRLNMAPSSDQTTDEAMRSVLEKVGLWDLVAARGGLDASVPEVALSHGQQQLFCLAIAMLRGSRIVIMDEASSGVDEETETKMHHLIQEHFRDCTVISVSHRLKMAALSDLVVVLSGGRCVELGHPRMLLGEKGEFWRLTGSG